jgi:hypothetical protein
VCGWRLIAAALVCLLSRELRREDEQRPFQRGWGLGFFLLFPLIFGRSSFPQNFLLQLFFHCKLLFIGELWLDHNHIGTSTVFYFYILNFF